MNQKNLSIVSKVKPLRSLSGLIDFESAVRWGSFKLAARELHKTPAAISQQIKQLEESLGFELFIRHPRYIRVTEKGRELSATVARLINDLHAKVKALQDGNDELVLRISTTHSFSMKWLIPKMYHFTDRYPDLDIRIESNDAVISLAETNNDIAIRYCEIASCDPSSILYKEHFVVVYSPDLLLKSKKLKNKSHIKPVDILDYPLIYEGTPENWLIFFKETHLDSDKYHFFRSYSHSGLLVQAAVAALGVALVPYSIAYEDILKGRLHYLAGKSLPSKYCYRMLCNPEKSEMPKIIYFRKWILKEIKKMEAHFKKNIHS